jgi:hypothetical protein
MAILAAVTCATQSLAQPADLTVDGAQSQIDLMITLDTTLGSESDSDTAPITGQMTIELDNYNSPTTIDVIDYDFAIGQLDFIFDYSFLGTITASAGNLTLSTPDGSPPATGPVIGGAFTVDNVPNTITGIVDVGGSGVVGALVGSTTVDLSTLPQQPISVSGTVGVDMDVITVTVSLPLDASQTDPDTGVVATFTGTATVIATGPVPEPDCLADVNGDGAVTPTDFSAWINAFNNNLPECDQNGDNACTPTDFSAWIANFNNGC